ncbi:unnamed protein product [Lampetra fluviatilis]
MTLNPQHVARRLGPGRGGGGAGGGRLATPTSQEEPPPASGGGSRDSAGEWPTVRGEGGRLGHRRGLEQPGPAPPPVASIPWRLPPAPRGRPCTGHCGTPLGLRVCHVIPPEQLTGSPHRRRRGAQNLHIVQSRRQQQQQPQQQQQQRSARQQPPPLLSTEGRAGPGPWAAVSGPAGLCP